MTRANANDILLPLKYRFCENCFILRFLPVCIMGEVIVLLLVKTINTEGILTLKKTQTAMRCNAAKAM